MMEGRRGRVDLSVRGATLVTVRTCKHDQIALIGPVLSLKASKASTSESTCLFLLSSCRFSDISSSPSLLVSALDIIDDNGRYGPSVAGTSLSVLGRASPLKYDLLSLSLDYRLYSSRDFFPASSHRKHASR
jgi:hypothetical protein